MRDLTGRSVVWRRGGRRRDGAHEAFELPDVRLELFDVRLL